MTPSRPSASWVPTAATELARAVADLRRLVAPDRCGACGALDEGLLCAACRARCRAPRGPACPRCGADWDPAGCGRCARFGRPFAFRRAAALWRYAGAPRRLVRNAKLGGRMALLAPAGRLMAESPRVRALVGAGARAERRDGPWLVVPLPARRGGSRHAEALAGGLADGLGLVLVPGLRRRRRVAGSQARQPGALRRRRLRGAFAGRPSRVAGRRVLLVDDVLSTGGTADAAARALRVAGAVDVCLATLAS